MSVSQTAEYALRSVVWLAQNPGEPQTTQQLADGTRVSVSYLPKVLQPLGRAGILTSQRGINGGYSLDRDPESLNVLEVINCVDPIQRIHRCPLKLATHVGGLCPLHQMLDEALGDLQRRFAETTIAELLRRNTGLKPLCDSASAGLFELSAAPAAGGPKAQRSD
ncbi:HTH-type transcriptional regulator CymR [Pirellulimonas nuda]|uniref:HTH-type transcriptional regulator CymR n=1 Tax=Pirellulimonas nuda TaxID=2528009 RepID=A0A518DHR7_9BACT|nr:Rrf2 family transcriptional regulator [Pirellulimonas nuda]QDU91023.1 HTH-type transcriptional regulator CymR [Pirellulimonas nuda]